MLGLCKRYIKSDTSSTWKVEQVLRRTHKPNMDISPPKGRFKETFSDDLTWRGKNGIISLESGKTQNINVVYN